MARRAAVNEVRPVLEAIDEGVDVVEKGLDAVEKGTDIGVEAIEKGIHVAVEETRSLVGFLRNPKTVGAIILIVNVAGAGIVGWKLAKRHYTKKYELELEAQIESTRKFFSRLNKVDESGHALSPEELAKKHSRDTVVEAAAKATQEYQEGPVIPSRSAVRANHSVAYDKIVATDVKLEQGPDGLTATGTLTEEGSNIFVEGRALNPDEFDIEAEDRDPESPYVITQEEFLANDPEHAQSSITYYAGDDILADERDVPIDEVESTVGTDNLSRFGHGSKDRHIVYIRNERTEMDFEIAYSDGKFSEEVHGFIRHSDRPVGRKFRLRADE